MKTAANSADPNVRQRHLREGQRHLAGAEPGGRQHQPAEKELIMSVIGTVILYPPADDGSGAGPPLRRAHHRGPARPAARSRRLGHGRQRRHRGVCLRRARRVPARTAPPSRPNPSPAGVGAAAPHVRTTSPPRSPTPADIGFVNNTTEPVYKMRRWPTPCRDRAPPRR